MYKAHAVPIEGTGSWESGRPSPHLHYKNADTNDCSDSGRWCSFSFENSVAWPLSHHGHLMHKLQNTMRQGPGPGRVPISGPAALNPTEIRQVISRIRASRR